MIYLKYFLLYSIFGFVFESLVYKLSNVNKHSGILRGPYTLVYGIGGMLSILANNYINNIHNPFLNILLSYLSFVIICTLVEFSVGHLIYYIYKYDSWDYSYKKYHFKKYICLSYSLSWGIISFIFVKLFNSFFCQVLNIVTDTFTIFFLTIIVIDIIYSIYKRYAK